ncbi:TIGR03088 family PEP-CTERM/XrtA system glycosyltransferase [Neptunomonas sp.]|uniref:TIGR03088 family PEP-CTERM/XrtA system glycosyltransferase n=1 Tax=Neptunomonas sp. TaxID=1971898 RepID=UPI00356469B5
MSINKPPSLIVHIIYELGTGGLENGLVNIINRMPSERYRHVIICLTHATDFSNRITAPDVNVIELHKQSGHDLSVYWRLQKIIWKLKPDIVHTRNLAALEMQALTILTLGTKRIHGEHGRDIYDLDGKNKRYNQFRKLMSLFVHQYTVVSKDLENWLNQTVNIPGKKIKQIYNGVDLSRFYPAKIKKLDLLPKSLRVDDAIILGTVGRIAEVKDQSTLLKAFNILLKENAQLSGRLRLIIIGEGPLYNSLADEVSSLGLVDKVWMPGDRSDIPELLRLMDTFILPSLNEGISNSILEAMATGLPVVATNIGGNPELVDEETGCLVTVGDFNGLASVLNDLVSNQEKMRAMGLAGLEKIQSEFDWDRTVANYLEIYDDLVR